MSTSTNRKSNQFGHPPIRPGAANTAPAISAMVKPMTETWLGVTAVLASHRDNACTQAALRILLGRRADKSAATPDPATI